jgi:hypothetical protein
MNHYCQFLLERGKYKNLHCGKIALWQKNGKHLCKKHCELLNKREGFNIGKDKVMPNISYPDTEREFDAHLRETTQSPPLNDKATITDEEIIHEAVEELKKQAPLNDKKPKDNDTDVTILPLNDNKLGVKKAVIVAALLKTGNFTIFEAQEYIDTLLHQAEVKAYKDGVMFGSAVKDDKINQKQY